MRKRKTRIENIRKRAVGQGNMVYCWQSLCGFLAETWCHWWDDTFFGKNITGRWWRTEGRDFGARGIYNFPQNMDRFGAGCQVSKHVSDLGGRVCVWKFDFWISGYLRTSDLELAVLIEGLRWGMKKPGCLGYIGDYTTQLCSDYRKSL